MDLGSNLRKYRKLKKITQYELADKINISRSTYAGYEVNASFPPIDKLKEIAKLLAVSLDEITKDANDPVEPPSILDMLIEDNPNIQVIPVLGTVKAGLPTFSEQDILDYEIVNLPSKDHENYFLLKVSGDSMINARIAEGDIVLVYKTYNIRNDDIVVMGLNNGEESTIKRYKEYGDGSKWLIAENPNYPPIKLNQEDNVRIIGKVVQVIIKL